MLYGAMNNKLAVVDSKVVVKKAVMQQWRIYGAAGEGPCAYPYEGKMSSDTFFKLRSMTNMSVHDKAKVKI